MKTATLIKRGVEGFSGRANLYQMNPPHEGHEYVIASAATGWVMETYLFPSNESGDVIDWLELGGSQKNITDHDTVLADLGYTVVKE